MTIRSRPSSAAFAEGWDRIFAKKPKTVTVEAITNMVASYRVPDTADLGGWVDVARATPDGNQGL